ncbi:Receptor-like kinase [Quillaja saponaria]|uniref:non-specific serine/threonine protein kinase n=1 Tax=Quillaja saponaria TaxID=32244 RepID=A0AAD7PU67_QUISA|nr:Receptor-like kinase [Quillaja saponaria]
MASTNSPSPTDSPPSTESPPPSSSSAPPPDHNSSPPPLDHNSSPPPSSPPPTDSSPPPPASSSPPPSPDKSNSAPPPPSSSHNNQSPPPFSPPPPSNNNNGNKNSPSPPPAPAPTSPPPPSPPPSPGSRNQVGLSPPPPPPPRHKSPSGGGRSSGSSSDSSPPDNDGSTPSLPLIVGVAAGAGLLLVVMILFLLSCTRRKKKPHSHIQYFSSNVSKGNWNKKNGPKNGGHIVVVPPPPGASQKGWKVPPPPPPPLVASDMSSSNLSSSGPQGLPLSPQNPSLALGFNKSTITFDELAAATGGFSQANMIGQGGFGYVHKGVLSNGKEIAVKSLKATSGQGDREFQAEVDIISRVHHRHLVSLVGYCIEGSKKLLVYEFVPNKTLEFHLHGKGRPVMDWGTRIKIAVGSAKGLAYLHEDCHPRIIHRDIKAANILIDDNFEAMVADFGLAKLNEDNHTHVSTRIMGTFGYLAPEYASSGKLTEKSDVFSYGVMLLELITGRPPVDTIGAYEEDSLVDWARPLCSRALETGDYEGLADPRLEGNYDKQEMARMVACAAGSIRHSARRRPRMSQILRALEGDASLDDLDEGVTSGQSSIFSSNSSEYTASTYIADMKNFRKMALSSHNYASSEFGQTSEYGLNPSSSSSGSTDIGRRDSRMHSP